MTLDERIEQLRELLALHEPFLRTWRIRCSAGKRNGEWHNLRCDALGLPLGVEVPRRGRHEYRTTLLLETECEPRRLPELLREAASGEAILDGTAVRFGDMQDVVLPRDPLPPMLFDSPVYRLIFSFSCNCPIDPDRLVMRGSPFYPCGQAAIDDWCEADEFDYQRPYGALTVRLPQRRARLGQPRLIGGDLRISVQGDQQTLAHATLKGAWWSANDLTDIEVVDLQPDVPFSLKVPKAPSGLDLYLVDRSGEVLDRHVERLGFAPWRERVLPDCNRLEGEVGAVQTAIASGEGQNVEFKEYVQVGDAKMREVARTIIAFANSEGGLLTIGIDDHCAVVGVERYLVRAARRKGHVDLATATNEYVAALRKAMIDSLNRMPAVNFAIVDLACHTVIAVFVAQGHEKPYAMRESRDIYVRRGPNNVKPDPDLELPPLLAKKPSPWPSDG